MKKNSPYLLEPNIDDITLVQITDTHLFSDEKGELLSVNTLDSFTAVVNDILATPLNYHAVIMTGDVSQDHTDASYARFEKGITPLQKPCFWLPGNHDYQPSMYSIYPSAQIQQHTHVLVGKHWQIILLDSQSEGSPHGVLSTQQLTYLEQTLTQYPERFSLILLHHHPRLVGSAWLDQHCLHNSDAFWKVIAEHQNVKAVSCGHVHQDFKESYHGVDVLTSPSTCIQFKSQSNDFALDTLTPGWRSLTLKANGEMDTQVHRLSGEQFLPDFKSQGY